MNPFETETMAELCLRQGHRTEALEIYRRLLARAGDATGRRRLTERVAAMESHGDPAALEIPGVRARWSDRELTIEWRLPEETQEPALEVLLVKTGPAGVETETRELVLDDTSGLLTLGTRDLHSARVAAGRRGPRGFVPLARG